ncbi:MAG: hypothetical protein RLZZ217_2163, partial [Planctomycetota bacterium]
AAKFESSPPAGEPIAGPVQLTLEVLP